MELKDYNARLAADPNSSALRDQRAYVLCQLGRLPEACADYVNILKRDPSHLTALNNLGCVMIDTGHLPEAKIAFQAAVTQHPNDPLSRVNLGNLLLQEIEQLEVHKREEETLPLKQEARQHYEHALRVKPDDHRAHEGLSRLLTDSSEAQQAAWHRREAFRNRSVIPVPYRGAGKPVAILHLSSSCGGNVRFRRFLDERVFQTYIVIPEFYDRKIPLPPHSLVLNGIGDTEVAAESLAAAQSLLALTSAPVINAPAAVLATGRSNNAQRLSTLPGVVAPSTVTLSRNQLTPTDAAATLARHGLAFPLLLRLPGCHTGLNFSQVESLAALPAALAEIPGQELIAMQYLDSRGADGMSRKYRVMMVGGQLYPLHLAVSRQWKIHYFTADMADHAEYRAEEAAFLEDMPRALGPLAMTALQGIQSVLGLDYGGIDFALNAQGEVLLFEANATMAVNAPDPGEQWDYRRPAYNRVMAAVQNMLIQRARPLGAGPEGSSVLPYSYPKGAPANSPSV